MKHIFIVNPKAGASDKSEAILAEIRAVFEGSGEEYYDFVTEYPGHATELVHKMCDFFEGEIIRFYACGGLGTVCEVINGVRNFENVELAVYPIVLENDILAAFPYSPNAFHSVGALKNGTCKQIDLIKCNDKYAVNHVCFGCEARVGKDVYSTSIRKVGLVGGKLPYLISSFRRFLITPRIVLQFRTKDGVMSKECSIASAMNGVRYGRSFYPNVDAQIDDGKIDLCIAYVESNVYNVSILKKYQSGNTKDNPEIFTTWQDTDVIVHKKDRTKLLYNYDGLIDEADELHITVLPGRLAFVLPAGLDLSSHP